MSASSRCSSSNHRLPPNSRTNIWVNAEIGPANAKAFSAVVRAQNGGLVAAERAMYWGNFREGHVVAGVTAEAAKWGFAEGIEDRFNGVAYDSYFLLNNAGLTDGSVKATSEMRCSVRPRSILASPSPASAALSGRSKPCTPNRSIANGGPISRSSAMRSWRP